MTPISIAGWIIGAIGTIGGAVFYLRFTATKANIEGKNETIKTQDDQLTALKDEVVRVNTEMTGYKKQAEALQEIAQQTPQIVMLTKAITKLTESIQKQHAENLKERKAIAEILNNIVANSGEKK